MIKIALGTPSLVADLRSPGSGQTGKSYDMLIQKIEESLANLQDKFPDFSEQSRYEIGGIVLNLGEEDTDAGTYAKYLERLIKDLRAEFHNDRDDARAASRHPSIERWFDNAGSFYLMGQASGEAMLKLLK